MITKSLTINGFTFNNYTSAITTGWSNWIQVQKIDGLDAPEIERDTIPLAYQHGVLESERFYRQRLITVTVNIIAPTRIQRNVLEKQLKAVLSPLYDIGSTGNLVYRDEDEAFDKIIFCKPTGDYKAAEELGEYGKRKAQFSLIAEDPRIYQNSVNAYSINLNKNLLLWTEDIMQASWNLYASATKTDSNTVALPIVGSGLSQSWASGGSLTGRTFTWRVKLSGIPGDKVYIYFRGTATLNDYGTMKLITLTATPTEYFTTGTVTLADNNIEVFVRRVNGSATATSVDMTEMQLTEASGVDIYHKNLGTYGSTNGVILGTTIPIYLATGVADAKNVLNVGTFATYPTVTLYGPILNPAIVNETTQKYLQLFYNLGVGEWLQFDMKNRKITKNDGTQVYGYLTDGSEFWDLIPGNNVIALAAENYSATAYVSVSFRAAYM